MMRVIIHANPDEMILAARAAQNGMERTEWPADGFVLLQYGDGNNPPMFAVKRNRASITVWSQQVAR